MRRLWIWKWREGKISEPQSWGSQVNFFIYFYSKVYEVKLVKVCWFLPPTPHSPVPPAERPGRRSRSGRCCWLLRSFPHTWRDRWAALTAALRRLRRLLSAGLWKLRFRYSGLPSGHLSTTGHAQTHTDTHARTHAHSCLAAFVSSGGKVVARWTHTQSLRKWSWSYDQRGGGGVAAQNTVYKSGLLNCYTIHSVNQRVF